MFEEGEVADHPVGGLLLLELAPLIGVEKPVLVGETKVLADQPQDLAFGTEGVVTNAELVVLLDVHFEYKKYIFWCLQL